jgi:hypothetical protein
MQLPPQLVLSLYERPEPPVVYDTPPVVARRRPLLARALGALRLERRRPALERVVPSPTTGASSARRG